MTRRPFGAVLLLFLYAVAVVSTIFVFMTVWGGFALSVSFWISLVAVLFAETAVWRYADHLIRNLERVKRMVPGYVALGAVIAAYWAAVVIFAFFTGIADLALPFFILIHILTLAAALVIGGLILLFIQSSSKHELDIQNQVLRFREMELSLKDLLAKIHSIDLPEKRVLEQEISELIDKLHYSDPVTTIPMVQLDWGLFDEMQVLREEVTILLSSGSQEAPPAKIVDRVREMKHRLVRRNEQLLAMKS